MPQLRTYGLPIDPGSLTTRTTVSAPTPPTATAPIQVRRYCRNGFAPQSEFANRIREAANFAVLYRSKQVFGGIGPDGVSAPAGGTGTTVTCYRAAFHTGPYTHALLVSGVIYPPILSATQAKVTVTAYSDAAMTVSVGSAVLYYGPKPGDLSFGWRLARDITKAWLDGVAPDTTYYMAVTSTDGCVAGGLAVYDMQSLSELDDGYLGTNLTMHSSIISTDRGQPHNALRKVWKVGGAHVFNWSTIGNKSGTNNDSNGNIGTDRYNTTTSTTLTNLIDRASTTISANSAGFTVDLTYKDRVSQSSGVPCVLAVWGYCTSPATGTVVLKNSAGTTLATVTGFTSTPGWITTAFSAPAVLDKLDLQFKTNTAGVRFFVGAVSCWEQE